jgi:hypothetical protein
VSRDPPFSMRSLFYILKERARVCLDVCSRVGCTFHPPYPCDSRSLYIYIFGKKPFACADSFVVTWLEDEGL